MLRHTADPKKLLDYQTLRFAVGPVLIRAGDDEAAMELGDDLPGLVFLNTATQDLVVRCRDGLVMSLYSLVSNSIGGAVTIIDSQKLHVVRSRGRRCSIVDARLVAERIADMAVKKGLWHEPANERKA